MTEATSYIKSIQAKQRATRHATSLPLFINTLTLGYLAYAEATTPGGVLPQILTPAITYTLLFATMVLQRHILGIGTGYDRYGTIAAAGFLAIVLLGPMFFRMLGAPFFLGLGLIILGARSRDSLLWIPGLALSTLAPMANFTGQGLLLLTLATAAFLLLSTLSFVRDRRIVGSQVK